MENESNVNWKKKLKSIWRLLPSNPIDSEVLAVLSKYKCAPLNLEETQPLYTHLCLISCCNPSSYVVSFIYLFIL